MNAQVEIELSIEAEAWADAFGGARAIEAFVALAVRAGLAAAGAPDHGFVISILLTGDGRIAELNRAFRGKDKSTDVLSWPSFDWCEPADAAALTKLDRGALLGDLALSYEIVTSDAKSYGRALEHHAAHLIVHGVLHLLGYDHEDEESAAVMEAVEDAALKSLGLPGRDD